MNYCCITLEQCPELFTPFIKKQTVKLYWHLYSFIKVYEYLKYLISVQILLLFDYPGSALKNTDTDRNLFFAKKQCLLFEKRRFPGAPTKEENWIFSESADLRKQNKNKIKKSTHGFLGIATCNTCAKFQGKK